MSGKPDANQFESEFDRIYESYPRKEGKAKGMKLCRAKIKSLRHLRSLESAVLNYAAKVERDGFAMLWSTFMGGRWEDYVEAIPLEVGHTKSKTAGMSAADMERFAKFAEEKGA